MDESHESPTGQLRFVLRTDRRVLQQQWEVIVLAPGDIPRGREEWRDVPLVADEETP